MSESCGTCATLKFQRVSILDHLAPAKLNVYPTRSSPEAKEAFEQFFHLKSLNSSIQDEITWRNTTNKGQIIDYFSKCSQSSVKMQLRCSQSLVKIQSKCNQNAIKMQSKCSPNSVKKHPNIHKSKCGKNAVKIQLLLGVLKSFQSCFLCILNTYTQSKIFSSTL